MHTILKSFSILLLGLVVVLLNVSCALGPVLNHETARSNGEGKGEFTAMSTSKGYLGLKFDYGILKDLDIGAQWESLNTSIYAKYSFLNQPNGSSLAGLIGTGSTFGGNFNYIDLTYSYMATAFEPYIAARYITVRTDLSELTGNDTSSIFSSITKAEFSYAMAFIGTKYWFSKTLALSAEGSSFISVSDSIQFSENALISLGFDIKF